MGSTVTTGPISLQSELAALVSEFGLAFSQPIDLAVVGLNVFGMFAAPIGMSNLYKRVTVRKVNGTYSGWTGNPFNASPGAYASSTLPGDGTTPRLLVTNLGFALPSNATVRGVFAVSSFYASPGGGFITQRMGVIKGGVQSLIYDFFAYTTAPNWSAGCIPTGNQNPGLASNFGEVLTYSDVNASNFGVWFDGEQSFGNSSSCRIADLQVGVHYTVP